MNKKNWPIVIIIAVVIAIVAVIIVAAKNDLNPIKSTYTKILPNSNNSQPSHEEANTPQPSNALGVYEGEYQSTFDGIQAAVAARAKDNELARDCPEISVEPIRAEGAWVSVLVTYGNCRDDSTTAIRNERRLSYDSDNQLLLEEIYRKTEKCHVGRGHQDFSTEPCL